MATSAHHGPVSKSAREFFAELRKLAFGPGKPDAHENRLDILELVAVHVGLRPAHLQGQGQHDASTLAEIAAVAERAGLQTRRTPALPDWTHRPYKGDPAFLDWQRVSEVDDRERLWVYRDVSTSHAIDAVLSGTAGVGGVLGYPPCCETAHSEEKLHLSELMERGYREEYGAETADDLVRLAREDRPVRIDVDLGERLLLSRERLPFVQFTACDRCIRDKGSPAARLNNSCRILARDLDRAFLREITAWTARGRGAGPTSAR